MTALRLGDTASEASLRIALSSLPLDRCQALGCEDVPNLGGSFCQYHKDRAQDASEALRRSTAPTEH
jgi:hypothetical protein